MTLRLAAVLALTWSFAALAQAPAKLGYQGRLLKTDGTPQTGVTAMTFSVFAAATGGAALWTETQSLGLSNGYYATVLGDVTVLGANVFDGTERFLELSVDGTPLLPRQRIDSVAYALSSTTALNVNGGTVNATSISINGTTVINGQGQLVGPGLRADAGSGLVIQGGAISLQGCTAAGEALRWNGTVWGCAQSTGGTVTTVTGSGPITITTGSSTPVVSIANGTSTAPGVLQVGQGLQVDAGVVSVVYGTTAGTSVSGDVVVRSPLTLTVGPTGQFPTVTAAWSFLSGLVLRAQVTLQLQNGTHAQTSALALNHPDGTKVTVRGDPTTPSNVVLTFPADTSGITVSNGNTLGYITGVTVSTSPASTLGAGIYAESGASITVDPSVRSVDFAYGYLASGAASLNANGAQASRTSGSGSGGFQAQLGSNLYAVGSKSTGYAFGFYAVYGGTLHAQNATASGGLIGFGSVWNSVLLASTTTAGSNSNANYYAANNSSMVATGSTANGPATTFSPVINTPGLNTYGFISY